MYCNTRQYSTPAHVLQELNVVWAVVLATQVQSCQCILCAVLRKAAFCEGMVFAYHGLQFFLLSLMELCVISCARKL